MLKTSETPIFGPKAPKRDLTRPPEITVRRSIAKAISWRALGTLDTLILSFVLITYLGPIFGLQPTGKEALETAGLIAITEVATKMVLYFVHERLWTRFHWGRSVEDGKRITRYRRTVIKTTSWRVIASTDTIVLAWLYTGNLATAMSIGGLEVITKLILYFGHERLWTKLPFGLQQNAAVNNDAAQQEGDVMTHKSRPKLRQNAHARWDNEGGAAHASRPQPYKSTPIFDENTLPNGLRKEHRTKAGVWAIIRVLEGRVRYQVLAPLSETMLDSDHPGRVMPEQLHRVEPMGEMRMQVDFYDRNPVGV